MWERELVSRQRAQTAQQRRQRPPRTSRNLLPLLALPPLYRSLRLTRRRDDVYLGFLCSLENSRGATPLDFGIGTSSSASMLPSRLHRRRSYSTTTSLASDSLGDERTEGASSSADEPEEADRLRLLSSPLVLPEEKGPSPSGEAGKRVWRMQSHGKGRRHHHHKHDSDGDNASGTDDDDDDNAKDTLVCGPFFLLVSPPPLDH